MRKPLMILALALAWCATPCVQAAEIDLLTRPAEAVVEIEHGDVLVLRLQGNASTGYAWQRVDDGSGVLVLDKHAAGKSASSETESERPRIGSPTTATYRYRAVKAGDTELRLRYRRPWEQAAPQREVAWRIRVR